MRKLLPVLFSTTFGTAFGQLLMPLQYDTTLIGQEIIFSGDSEYHSTSLRKAFANKLIYGGEIPDAVKDKTFAAHGGNLNRFGKDIQAEVEYRNYKVNMFGNEKWGFLVKGGYYFIGAGSYTTDLFGIAFYGNEAYLGRTAEFKNTRANFSAFQKLGFGVIGKKSKSSVTLSFVNVSNFYKGGLGLSQLTQNDDASNIGLLLNGSFAYTDKVKFNNGNGFAIDADFRIPVEWLNEKKAYIQVQVKNIGAAYMHNGMRSYTADSVYLDYNGFTFNQLFENQSFFSGDFSVLDSLNIQSSDKKSLIMLPGMLQAGKIIDEHYAGRWQSFFGIRLYPTLSAMYPPLIYIGGNWRPQQWLDLGLSGSYGGFGSFRAGFYASFKLDKLHLGLGTEDIYGLVSRNAFGESFNVRLRCKF